MATFAGQREDTEALRRVNSVSLQAWNRFRDSVVELCQDERLHALEVTTEQIQKIHNDVYAAYSAYRYAGEQQVPYQSGHLAGVRRRGATAQETQDFQSYLAANEEKLMAQINEVFNKVGNDHSFQIQWAGVRTNWNTVDQYVRLQRFERDLPWFDIRVDAELSHRLSETANPLTEFFAVHHVKKRNSNDSMIAARAVMLHDAETPKEQLDARLFSGDPPPVGFFGHHPVDNYYATALLARGSLISLRDAVLRVDKTGWPREFGTPQSGI